MTPHDWRIFRDDLMNGIWLATIVANIVGALIVVATNQYQRWRSVFLWCVSSVFIDFLFWRIKIDAPTLYEPFRLFVFYCWTYLIEVLVIAEAFRRRERRIQFPVEAQLLLGIAGLLKHRYLDAWGIYYFDCASRGINLAVILWCNWILYRHQPIPQRSEYGKEESHDGRSQETTLPRR